MYLPDPPIQQPTTILYDCVLKASRLPGIRSREFCGALRKRPSMENTAQQRLTQKFIHVMRPWKHKPRWRVGRWMIVGAVFWSACGQAPATTTVTTAMASPTAMPTTTTAASSTTTRNPTTTYANLGANVYVEVSAGSEHSCGTRADGTTVCWGSNHSGELEVPAGEYRTVFAEGRHSCGIKTDGAAVCWGDNHNGELDIPDGTFQTISVGPLHAAGSRPMAPLCVGEINTMNG